jgi:uncharacterized protein (TIGR02246 family)
MADADEIQQLINLYHEAGSVTDYERMIATFTPDARWETPGGSVVGLDAIREMVAGVTGALEYVAQVNAPAQIAVDGDTAVARSGIRESGKLAGQDMAFEVYGVYHDTLARTPDGWRFSSRRFDLRWMHRVPVVPQ